MAHQFQFNRKNHAPVVVEGRRVDLADGCITVVDTQGQPLVTFDQTELSSLWRVIETSTPSL
ncbi:MAG: hypothetical protein K0S58_1044 [Nitrospira sp.]|jgi:hypothetical protein|nr:hypothetical protein [Nitrospira sp.]